MLTTLPCYKRPVQFSSIYSPAQFIVKGTSINCQSMRLEDMGFTPAQPAVHHIPGYHWENSAESLAIENKRMGTFLEYFRQQVRGRIRN